MFWSIRLALLSLVIVLPTAQVPGYVSCPPPRCFSSRQPPWAA